ncbi:DUF2231 domain-containing protein [Labilibaculum antarcticum]|uniref:DUF2231 domain-containing protein n=1 Tax=Labilibaculum antarcticum TaxID=1717717 RepID=A0A1Y1CQZ6_9BACT|nr:DUF2231 domain-containing protein [Labilibaculum antarcticum]BAX81671.1 hypothetical protein ALGA_3373 [Labilibaculum antarcticum]
MFTATHLHAMIVHFPVALVLVAFFTEVLGLILKKKFYQQATFYILFLAALGAIVAYLTGDAAGDGMDGGSLGLAMEAHAEAASFTLWFTIAAAGAKSALYILKKEILWLKILAFVLLLAAAGGVVRTGYLGGQLVFKHAAGVELGFSNFGTLQNND